jgi:ABC-2 type transport system permease protein
MTIWTLAQRELRSLFLSPLAWSILAVSQFILAYLFLSQLNDYIQVQPQLKLLDNAPGVTQLVVTPLYGSAAFILMLIVPLLTMRLISEERRSKSLALLFSAPVSMTEIILGKYLGILLFLLLMILLLSLMPLSLLGLLVGCFAALGLYMSTLTVQPTVAAVSTFGALLLFWIIDWAGDKVSNTEAGNLLGYLSMLRHFEALARGVVSSVDVAYFLLFITVFLVLAIRRLDADRLQH